MTYTAPASLDLIARYPEFSNVGEAIVEAVLTEAGANMDDCWPDADRTAAILALAAHMLVMEGEPDRSNSIAGTSSVGRTVLSQTAGDTKETFAPLSLDGTDFSQTVYGRGYLSIMSRNVSSVMVVTGPDYIPSLGSWPYGIWRPY